MSLNVMTNPKYVATSETAHACPVTNVIKRYLPASVYSFSLFPVD